ncbi:MAG: SH3 domain-containing protein [Parvularculaceae bacterium]
MGSRAIIGYLAVASWVVVAAGAAFGAPSGALAGEVRTDTPSGRPVPRFVSLKSSETNCRIGPSFDHPVRYVFKKAGAPVIIVAESVDHWRKIRDFSGDECWVHQTTLKAVSQVIALAEVDLHARPRANAPVRGRLGVRAFAKIEKRRDGWLLLSAADAKGWAPAGALWGASAPQ